MRTGVLPFRHSALVLSAVAHLATAGTAMAQDAVRLPLDLGDLPGAEVDAGWSEQTTTKVLRWEIGAGVDLERLNGPITALAKGAGAQPFLSLGVIVDTRLGPTLSFRGRAVAHHTEHDTTAFVQSAVLTWAPQGQLRLSLGKDYLGWSFSSLEHVMDPSPRKAARIDASDTSEDYAHPFAQVSLALDGHDISLVAMSEGHDLGEIATDPALYALRYTTSVGKANLAAQIIAREGGDTEYGLALDMEAGSAILSAEVAAASRQRLPRASVVPGGGAFAAPENRTTWQSVLGLRVPLSSRWQLEAAYLHNGHGYSDAEWSGFLAAEQATLVAMATGNFQRAGFLGAAQTAHDSQFLRRNYVSGAFSTLEDLSGWALTAGALHGLDDQGTFGFLEAGRAIGQNGRLALSLSGGAGPSTSEFARRATTGTIRLSWEF